jgi:hypothetical protein
MAAEGSESSSGSEELVEENCEEEGPASGPFDTIPQSILGAASRPSLPALGVKKFVLKKKKASRASSDRPRDDCAAGSAADMSTAGSAADMSTAGSAADTSAAGASASSAAASAADTSASASAADTSAAASAADTVAASNAADTVAASDALAPSDGPWHPEATFSQERLAAVLQRPKLSATAKRKPPPLFSDHLVVEGESVFASFGAGYGKVIVKGLSAADLPGILGARDRHNVGKSKGKGKGGTMLMWNGVRSREGQEDEFLEVRKKKDMRFPFLRSRTVLCAAHLSSTGPCQTTDFNHRQTSDIHDFTFAPML